MSIKCKFDGHDIVCRRCKSKRGTSGCLACVRVQLPDLTLVFCSSILFDSLSLEPLESFTQTMVHRYTEIKMEVELTSGFGPAYPVEAYEALPVHDELLYTMQYKRNPVSKMYEATKVWSPCLAMQIRLINVQAERKRLDSHLDRMLKESFDEIPRRGFRGCQERKIIEKQIIVLLHSYHLSVIEQVSPCFQYRTNMLIWQGVLPTVLMSQVNLDRFHDEPRHHARGGNEIWHLAAAFTSPWQVRHPYVSSAVEQADEIPLVDIVQKSALSHTARSAENAPELLKRYLDSITLRAINPRHCIRVSSDSDSM